MSQSRLSAAVTCKQKNIRLEFAILFDPKEEPIETLGTAWIEEGLTEAFWENGTLFEDTAFEQFGKFEIVFTLDGDLFSYPFEFDVNAWIRILLQRNVNQ